MKYDRAIDAKIGSELEDKMGRQEKSKNFVGHWAVGIDHHFLRSPQQSVIDSLDQAVERVLLESDMIEDELVEAFCSDL